jgi:hypothetical protein
MRTKFIAFTAGLLLLANGFAFAGDLRSSRTVTRQSARLVSMLPASDAIITFDAKQFLGSALPKVLASNPTMLAEVQTKLVEAEARTGIDLRKFDQVAVGISYRKGAKGETDYEPVVIANGDINAAALISVAKLSTKGTYRTETISGRTVYIFSASDVLQKNAPVRTNNSKIAGWVDDAVDSITKDVAVTAYDKGTLVMGPLERVKETLDARSNVGADLKGLLPTAPHVASFAARLPNGLGQLLPLDSDDLGMSLESIEYVWGSFDVNVVGAELLVNARTKRASDAQNLKDTIEGLRILGNIALGGSKSPDKQVYTRMVKNAKIDSRGNELVFSLTVPQADIDTLISGIK